ncbi:uncharacterized protein RAG0_08994 [Rhynchosporium agropyri]|uniref:Uncharacterized protein n=2 Tax=Rhynchosporium TaxID=38037 RepID=A0A1E1MLW5_RHYSE|nr:uncharacterized protein RAG0_08994 [Rhynchosporium agropyri]CZT50081.1 uncharacterized protein RSE6_11006 [Rhynchosporium secalis]
MCLLGNASVGARKFLVKETRIEMQQLFLVLESLRFRGAIDILSMIMKLKC